MRIGDLSFQLLSDGNVHMDVGGVFGLVPPVLYKRYILPDDTHRVPMILNCMLIQSRGKTILVDTGLGEKLLQSEWEEWNLERPRGGLVTKLNRLGISPSDIDIVIDTHLHSDHCGGNTRMEAEQVLATFPNACYWVQRIEWADFSYPDARTRSVYAADNFTPILQSGQARLLHGDTEVTDQVRCVVTPGHTRGHQSVMLKSGDWYGLFVGDMASYAIHMVRTPWLTAYDVDPLRNIATKERWQRWALERDAILFFQHDPLLPVARLRLEGDSLSAEPVEVEVD